VFLIYVDDSGDEHRTVLSALAIPEHRWSSYLKGWLTWRRQLFRDHKVPAGYEIHAQRWLSKSPDPLPGGVDVPILRHDRDARRERFRRYESALKVISTFADASLFTIYAPGTDKFALYGELLVWLDEWLRDEDAFGLIILDGLDQGLHYRARHRDLPIKTRRILEDPVECPSHGSQLIQMVDCCVHAAFRHVRGDPGPIRSVYPTTLGPLLAPGSAGTARIRNWP